MTMRRINTVLFLLSTLLVTGGLAEAPAHAEGLSDMALRSSGQLLQLVPGSYGDLFPDGTATAAETPVLALEIGANEGPPGRLLVPGTEDPAAESQALLLYDDTLDAAVMLWRCGTSDTGFQLHFATLRVGDEGLVWSEVFSVQAQGESVDFTAEPLLAPTRDRFTLELEEGLRIETRQSTIHLFWHQGQSVLYTGLNFLEGVYAGRNEILDLSNSFLRVPKGEEEAGTALPAELAELLAVTPGSDESTLLVTFANAATARLGTLALRAVPLRLSALGDDVRQEILDAADLYDPNDISPFKEKIGASIVIIGHRYRLHPAITDYLARRMDLWILEHGADYGLEQFAALVEDARGLAVDVTSSIYSSTATDPFNPEGTIIEINLGGFLGGLDKPSPAQFLDVEERANLAPPTVPAVPQAITSANGETLLLVWSGGEESGGLDYLESREGGAWSEPRTLTVSEALPEERAYSLLRQKIR